MSKAENISSGLRESFMREFVLSLIHNTPYKELPEQKTPEQETLQEFQQSPFAKAPQMPQLPKPPQLPQMPQLPRPPALPQMPRINQKQLTRPQIKPFSTPIQPPISQPPKIMPSSKPTTNEKINLGRITKFLLDPSVISVECPGPTKNIVVNQAGKIQSTSVSLTKEEINTLMEEISDKTRIPITSGLFKAVFQDLLITAVTSEFVGSR